MQIKNINQFHLDVTFSLRQCTMYNVHEYIIDRNYYD